MHELGLVEAMLNLALEQAARQHAHQIAQFNVEISAWADESEESLSFYLDNLSQGTIAEGARIQIRRVPVRGKCASCGNEFEFPSRYAECPACHSLSVKTDRKSEFRLASIEVK